MKLVDILARELVSWPWPYVFEVGQACDGSLHPAGSASYTAQRFTLCDSYAEEVVDRSQWQAAVDALKAEKVCDHYWIADSDFCVKCGFDHPSRAEWSGEGKPPVGTVCEWNPNQDGWVKVEILGHSGEETWFRRDGHESSETCLRMAFFRPIRTPEQIAEDESNKAVYEMAELLKAKVGFGVNLAEMRALYDAGYRKQEAK